MGRSERQKFNLKVSSITENLEIIREFIHNLAVKGGFNDEDAYQIELAVDEACTNVIKHAYKFNDRRIIDINVYLYTNKMEINISDKGKGFDLKKLTEPDLKEYAHAAKRGGLGIHLMRSLMDEVNFTFNPEKKNTVSLVKYLTKKSA